MLQRETLDLTKRLAKLATDMVNDQLPRTLKMPRDFNYTKLVDLFSNPIPEQEIENTLSKFPHDQSDLANSFMATLARVHKQLSDLVPVMQYQTCLGPINIQPTGDKLFAFWNQYWVLSDPSIVFTLAQSAALLPEQVKVLAEFYPSLYEQIKSATLAALVKHKMKPGNSKFLNLPPRIDRGISTLLQQKTVPFGSNARQALDDRSQVGSNPTGNAPPQRSLESQAQKAANIT
jgi:hypothetical protein